MKKKTFIVQLLDSKSPSRMSFTQVEDANFYSNDTDASLVFIPHEDAFDFQAAKVVMYNRGDESLVERDMEVTTEDGRKVASYELPDEIISHWGDWTAQPVFISNGEIYSGSIVPFSVIRYLMHERPPKLTEVVSVTDFIQQSQALVDDMEQAEAQRVSAESSRVSAESQRLSDEATRVSAEAQRQIDHANRSAELDGKADKVVINNILNNGDFSDGVTGWSGTLGNLQAGSGTVFFTPTDPASRMARQNDVNINHVYYHAMRVKATGSTPMIYPTSPAVPSQPIEGTGEWEVVSTNHKPTVSRTEIRYVYNGAIGVPIEVDWILRIDLTETFGSGNEPTKEEMDELIKVTGYIDGKYALNNKEMLIWTLALIRRNKNAIVALGGA